MGEEPYANDPQSEDLTRRIDEAIAEVYLCESLSRADSARAMLG
ncbi:MAG: hypothetical protein WKF51_10480 [Geodermatophilaceae bacterium]